MRFDCPNCSTLLAHYRESRYAEDHRKTLKRFIYGSENGGGWAQWLAVRDHDYICGQFL
jgi:hypothetical protein